MIALASIQRRGAWASVADVVLESMQGCGTCCVSMGGSCIDVCAVRKHVACGFLLTTVRVEDSAAALGVTVEIAVEVGARYC